MLSFDTLKLRSVFTYLCVSEVSSNQIVNHLLLFIFLHVSFSVDFFLDVSVFCS